MRRIALRTTAFALIAFIALLTVGLGTALADGGKGVAVKPLTPRPGDTITVKGDRLGANSTVEVRVIGAGVDIDLGEIKADAEGDFSAEFRLPAELKPGSYQVQATGTESATTQITVVGGGGESPATIMEEMPVRSRPLGEVLAIAALFGALAGAGLFFARIASAREARAAR